MNGVSALPKPIIRVFSIIELRLNARHEGEGKASVIGKVAVDTSANTIALDGYASLPVTFKDVKPRTGN